MMKIKSVLAGVIAFAIATTVALGFNRTSDSKGAYLLDDVCTPIETDCILTPGDDCQLPVGPGGSMEQIYYNENWENPQLPATCEDKLFKRPLW